MAEQAFPVAYARHAGDAAQLFHHEFRFRQVEVEPALLLSAFHEDVSQLCGLFQREQGGELQLMLVLAVVVVLLNKSILSLKSKFPVYPLA